MLLLLLSDEVPLSAIAIPWGIMNSCNLQINIVQEIHIAPLNMYIVGSTLFTDSGIQHK